MEEGGRGWRRKVSICEKTEGKRTMSVRSRLPFPISCSLSLSLGGSIHFTLGNTCASAAPHFRQETFYRHRFLTAREIALYAASSRKTRRRIVVSLSGNAFRGAFTRKRNTTASYECRGSLISARIFRRMANGKASLAYRETQPSSCYAPAERMYCNFVSTNQNRRNRNNENFNE